VKKTWRCIFLGKKSRRCIFVRKISLTVHLIWKNGEKNCPLLEKIPVRLPRKNLVWKEFLSVRLLKKSWQSIFPGGASFREKIPHGLLNILDQGCVSQGGWQFFCCTALVARTRTSSSKLPETAIFAIMSSLVHAKPTSACTWTRHWTESRQIFESCHLHPRLN